MSKDFQIAANELADGIVQGFGVPAKLLDGDLSYYPSRTSDFGFYNGEEATIEAQLTYFNTQLLNQLFLTHFPPWSPPQMDTKRNGKTCGQLWVHLRRWRRRVRRNKLPEVRWE